MSSIDERYDEAIKLQQEGDLEQAVSVLEQIAAEDADYALAHAALAVFYGKLERHDDAVRHAETVCQLEPDDPFSFMAKSMICQKAGRNAEAEQAMMQAMEKQWAARKDPGQ